MNCGNCETPINLPLSETFVLNEHLCEACQRGATTLKLIITRASPTQPWGLESSQPLRVAFNVPGQDNDSTNVASS